MLHTQEKDLEGTPLIEQSRTRSKKVWVIPTVIGIILAMAIPIVVIYSRSHNIDTSGTEWMQGLSNATILNRVSMPGTHNSGAVYTNTLTQCQIKSIHDQLLDGIRFFDIDLYHYQNVLRVHQLWANQYITWQDVQTTFIQYLDDHPSEIIVVRVHEEHIDYPGYVPPVSTGNTMTFAQRFAIVTSPYSSYYWQNSTYPAVGEVRGKIVPLCDFHDFNNLTCINYDILDDQDDYTIDSCDEIPIKFQGVVMHIDYGLAESAGWFVNFAAGAVGWQNPENMITCTPWDIANGVNQRLLVYLANNKTINYTGIIPMDFENPVLNKLIYQINDLNANSFAAQVYQKLQELW